jgi:hypothetical protein
VKLAIMQPYFLPYIGYWQLLRAVDRFVIYDDVNYIKGGWISRNRILINGSPSYLTLPLQKSSPSKRICDISLHPSPVWRDKMIKTVENTYRKAPYFDEVFPILEKIIRHPVENLAEYLAHQVQVLSEFMNIKTRLVMSSRHYGNGDLSGQARVLDICKREGAATYINPQGGQSLYNTEVFRGMGIDLRFIVMRPLPYRQRTAGFIPHLSIIDALMEIGASAIGHHLDAFDLITGGNINACQA